ncbi:MAG: PD-(D/E)XK nuclease family protein [Gemmatimonadota bacterium]
MRLLLDQLEALDRAHPHEHKLLVCQDVNHGRELLVSLARRTGGWMGWEPSTLGSIAHALAFTTLGRAGLRTASDLEIAAVADAALVAVVTGSGSRHRFADLTASVGFRGAVRDALLELRVAGISPAQLAAAAPSDSPAREIAPVLAAYEARLARARLVDAGGVLRMARDAFQVEAPFVLPERVVLLPGLTPRGLAATLFERLISRGARQLAAPVASSQAPHDPDQVALDAFRAATPADEVREIIRRIRAEGRSWDEVELIVTDPDGYAVALDALAAQLEIPVTILPGVPLARSRFGRALERWLTWLESGLPAELIGAALDAGDLSHTDPLLPLVLRSLGIGWGRPRYASALTRLQSGDFPRRPRVTENEAPIPEAIWAEACRQTATFLESLLAATPAVPELGSANETSVSAGELARSAIRFLALLSEGSGADAHARARLLPRFEDLAAVRTELLPFSVAMAEFRGAIADFRVWSDLGPDGKPWLSSGGRLHLTDLTHAGASARPRSFMLGLDADRTAGPRLQDPFLPDELRTRLGGALATSAARREERRELLARAFAGCSGTVTISYAINSDGGREASPAAILLAASRTIFAEANLSYETLGTRLGPPVSPVPEANASAIDGRDAWFKGLAPGALLLDGSAAVRATFVGLSAGLASAAAWHASELLPPHGTVPRAERFDPRLREGTAISASSLETLARCPRAWFYRYVLRIRPPDEPVFDPDRWLDPGDRGSLLHTVFERFGRAYAARREAFGSADTLAAVLDLGERVIAEWRAEVPPPSDAVFEREREDIRRVLRGFLLMEQQLPPGRLWHDFELAFGGADKPVSLTLPDGHRLALFGRVDRVDRLTQGGLVVVDYKTGSSRGFNPDPDRGPFDGGRHLQAGLYAHAVGLLLRAPVVRSEYRFPTEKGEHRLVSVEAGELERMPAVVTDLLDEVRAGHFLPTTDSNDCRFCDFQPICRVRALDYSKLASPRAEWAAEQGEALPAYGPMRRRRGEDA